MNSFWFIWATCRSVSWSSTHKVSWILKTVSSMYFFSVRSLASQRNKFYQTLLLHTEMDCNGLSMTWCKCCNPSRKKSPQNRSNKQTKQATNTMHKDILKTKTTARIPITTTTTKRKQQIKTKQKRKTRKHTKKDGSVTDVAWQDLLLVTYSEADKMFAQTTCTKTKWYKTKQNKVSNRNKPTTNKPTN